MLFRSNDAAGPDLNGKGLRKWKWAVTPPPPRVGSACGPQKVQPKGPAQSWQRDPVLKCLNYRGHPTCKAGDRSKSPGTRQEDTSISAFNFLRIPQVHVWLYNQIFKVHMRNFRFWEVAFCRVSENHPLPLPPLLHRSMIHGNISKFNVTNEVHWSKDPYYGSEAAIEYDYCLVLWQTSPLAFKLILKYFPRNSQQYKP